MYLQIVWHTKKEKRSFLLFLSFSLPTFFPRSLSEHYEGAAGISPNGHSVKWTQLWPPRHPPGTANETASPRRTRRRDWSVGWKYDRRWFAWREKRREWRGSGPPPCTLTDPLPRTGREISRTKASCRLLLKRSLGTKLLSDGQTDQSLREVACRNLVLSHIPDVSSEWGTRVWPEPLNRKWVWLLCISQRWGLSTGQ